MKSTRALFLLVTAVFMLALIAGCGSPATPAPTAAPQPTAAPAQPTAAPAASLKGELNVMCTPQQEWWGCSHWQIKGKISI